MLLALLFLTTIGMSIAWVVARRELAEQKIKLRRYSSLSSTEEFQRQLNSTNNLIEFEISDLQGQKQNLKIQVDKLQQQLRGLDAKIYLQSLETYESYYNFISSDEYLIQLKCNKEKQETMKNQGKAYLAEVKLIMENSERKGKKMTQNLLDLIRLAFENQCNFALQEARYNNSTTLEKRIISAFEKINKLSATTYCKISSEYLNLKIEELRLKCEFEQKRQKEKEKQQDIDRQRKEEQKRDRESKKAKEQMEEAEKRERSHQEELAQIRWEIVQVEGEAKKQLQVRIQQLEQQVAKDQHDVETAALRCQRAKEGYIFVASNASSFKRENVYRIFMTRRENEDDYVRAMNPQVPFPFDIHYKIYTEQPLDTLRYLHQRFDGRRVNLDNERRDFFQVPFDEIEQAVEEVCQEQEGIRVLEFNRQPQNPEYLRSLFLERKRLQQ